MNLLPDPRTVLISALCGFLLGAVVTGMLVYKLEHAQVIAARAQMDRLQGQIAQARADALEEQRKRDTQYRATLDNISSALHQSEAKNEQLENERDRAIAAGTQRVYVRANCPADNSMSATGSTASGTDAPAAELDSAYRPTLSSLRRGGDQCHDQIVALQARVRADYARCGPQ